VVAPTAYITTAQTFLNLRQKKMANFEAFLAPAGAGGPGRTLDAPGSNLFSEVCFFLLLKERKRIIGSY
jgi:hypothetical protein